MSNHKRFGAERAARTLAALVCLSLLTACASLVVGDMAKGGNPDYQSDLAIAQSVERNLRGDAVLGGYGIRASVYQGTATLNGRVDTAGQKQRATDLAYRVAGVKRVVSRVSYGGP